MENEFDVLSSENSEIDIADTASSSSNEMRNEHDMLSSEDSEINVADVSSLSSNEIVENEDYQLEDDQFVDDQFENNQLEDDYTQDSSEMEIDNVVLGDASSSNESDVFMSPLFESSSSSSSLLFVTNDNDNNNTEENRANWLDNPIYAEATINGGNALYQILKTYITNRLSKKALSDILSTIDLLLPNDHTIPRSKFKLLSLIDQVLPSSQSDFATKHRICSKCFYYLGKWSDDPLERCTRCDNTKVNSFFLELDLESQLRTAFEVRDVSTLLDNYRTECATQNPEYLYDLTSGTEFRRLKTEAIPGEYDVFLLWFTDGLQVSKSGKSNIWPVYAQIVNIAPKYRRSFQFVCGIFYTNRSSKKPDMNSYLQPFVLILKNLFTNGFQWFNRVLNRIIVTKVVAPVACLDAPARAAAQNVQQYNGEYSCGCCEEKGESCETGSGSNWIFPVTHDHSCLRTAARMEKQTKIVEKYKDLKHFKGVKGDAIVTQIPHFDRSKGFVPDYMHAVLLGVMLMLLTLWCSSTNHEREFYLRKDQRIEIDKILEAISPPDDVTRTPRLLSDLNLWKASELRAFLLYYGPIVLKKRLSNEHFNHFLLLSRAIYILLKDEISPTERNFANTLLHIFVIDFERLYGRNKCSYNVHQLKHMTLFVSLWGPLWAWSAFSSEDHNGELLRMTHGTKNVDVELSNTIKIIQCYQNIKYLMNPIRQNQQPQCRTHGPSTKYNIEESDLLVILHVTRLTKEQLHQTKPTIFSRCLINNEIYTSELYTRQKKRSNFIVQWKEDVVVSFGAVKFFLMIEGNLFAVLRQLIISNDKSQEIKNTELEFDFNESIKHVRDSYCTNVIPIQRIFTKVLRVQDYICLFPNNVEKK